MRKLTIVSMLALLLIGTGCQSDKAAQNGEDEEATAEQPAEEENNEQSEDNEQGDEQPAEETEEEGQEHPGDEHPGDDAEEGEEHPGDEHPGDSADKKDKKKFTAKEIKEAMNAHIEGEAGEDGVFTINDDKSGDELTLEFVKIHDPVREMKGKGYFACTDFHVKGDKEKVYDLDFWLNPKDGNLTVTNTKIHKHPVQKDGSWAKKARYTFKNDKVVDLK